MKKIVSIILLAGMMVGLLSGCSDNSQKTETKDVKIGGLTFQNGNINSIKELGEEKTTLVSNITPRDVNVVEYDNLAAMQLALDSGKIDVMNVPDFVGSYFVKNNKGYALVASMLNVRVSYAMGFTENNAELRDRVNEAIGELQSNGTLTKLEDEYIYKASGKLKPVQFQTFDGAETITVALTGDMPPMDYIGADGTPAGYNTALVSEVAKIMKVNIKTINIEAAARSSALASGKADIVFWYDAADIEGEGLRPNPVAAPENPEILEEKKKKEEALKKAFSVEGIIFSESYFRSNNRVYVGKSK